MLGTCVICKRKLPPSKADLMVCHSRTCKAEYPIWCEANFDLMPEHNRHKTKYETRFWEVTPEQKKHYARFYELMRPRTKNKKRPCLKCGKSIGGDRALEHEYRLCPVCHESNRVHGKIAHYAI